MRFKQSKYYNKKVSIDGYEFDSEKEASRYYQLKLLLRAGEISNLELQKEYELIPAQYETFERYSQKGKRLKNGVRLVERKTVYVADFVYIDTATGKTVVEDVKGYKEGSAYQIFTIKRKLMLYKHGIRIREI